MKYQKLTRFVKPEEANKKWYEIDATGKVLGRLASEVAKIIRGKNKPSYTPNMDTGDYVVVINADKVILKGKRAEMKEYFHHTMYPGGAKFKSFKVAINENPEFVIRHAVRGMLPKNRLGDKLINHLKVYTSKQTNPHKAQKPETLSLS